MSRISETPTEDCKSMLEYQCRSPVTQHTRTAGPVVPSLGTLLLLSESPAPPSRADTAPAPCPSGSPPGQTLPWNLLGI